jgi:hypothetical protein
MKAACVLTLALGLSLATVSAMAQDTTKSGGSSSGSVSVTGCLQKGSSSDSYTITGSDGKSYELKSSSVNLGSHVGHKVTITGNASSASGSATKSAGAGESTVDVSNLQMVSTSCQ